MNNKNMRKCILLFAIFVFTASYVKADTYYYNDYSGYNKTTNSYSNIGNTYYSQNSNTSYTRSGNDIYGSDGSHYYNMNGNIQDMSNGSLYQQTGNTIEKVY